MKSQVSFWPRYATTYGILLAIICIVSGCAWSPEARSAKHLETGKKLLQKNDSARAILEFLNAAKATPKNPEVYYQLSLAYQAAGDAPSTVSTLRKALELNPKHAAAQLRLAQLMATVNDKQVLEDAQQRLKALLKDAPENAAALHTLALTEWKLGESQNALVHLERALASAPQELTIAVNLAEAKIRQNDSKGAEEVLKRASESAPKSIEAVITLGQFYVKQKKTSEAEQQFQRAIAMDPNGGLALLNLAMLRLRAGRKQEAEQNFKRLSGLPDKKFRPAYALFLFEEGRQDEAVREYERLVRESPDDREARTRLVAAYQNVNRKADAERILDAALKKNPKDLDALVQRSELLIAEGKYQQAEINLNLVLRLKPDAPELHYIMAKLQEARGLVLSFRQELTKALQLNPYFLAGRLELTRSLLSSNATAQTALSLLDETPAGQKEELSVLIQRNWVFWTLGDLAQMRRGIDAGLSKERSAELLIQDGLWKLKAGKVADARRSLEDALNLNPADLRGLAALTQAYEAQKQTTIALQKVKEYAARQPRVAVVQEFLANLLAARGEREAARVAFDAAKAAGARSADVELGLVRIDVLDGKWDEARKRLASVIATDKDNMTARLWLGNLEQIKGNRGAAVDQFRKVVEAKPENAQALNNLAYLLAETGSQLDEALKYAEKAVALAPERATYCDTLGWVLYRKGLYPSALKYLERANAGTGGDLTWKYHLAMAYAKVGDMKQGRSVLEAALKLNPNLPEAKAAQQLVGMPSR
jgi:putative PEP-CTERM system TPR-repeat lipoprotein